ncbi:MAG: hypothetical protein QXP91_10495 [Candidatus Methanomethylicia archaeon]
MEALDNDCILLKVWVLSYSEVALLRNRALRMLGSGKRSLLEGDHDIVAISDNLPRNFKERGELIAEIEEEANLPLYHPFQIHLATWKEAVSEGISIFVGMSSEHREFRRS